MVINRRDIKRKRKEVSSTCAILDIPKRTKVHAQRKFAQGSNVSSPVITPVKEIEKQEKLRPDVLPEPQELLPMNRPHTEDFLTFLCFRGTSMLPTNLNFFNTASVHSRVLVPPIKNEPIDACSPLINLSTRSTAGMNERPFIAFGVRKRADPILVSKHMDKKRRHALALQALRRKYQEQKMAKIRAVTISKLSEKTTSKSLVRTRSVTKTETTTTKKSLTQKTRVKIVSTKRVRVTTRSTIKAPLRSTLNSPIRKQIKKKMCLRSFRGRFIQRELNMQTPKKKDPIQLLKKCESKNEKEKEKDASSEFSSDDDEPLVNTIKVDNPSSKVSSSKVTKKLTVTTKKKPVEVNFRVTRASHPLLQSARDQKIKRKIQISKTLASKLPFVKLTPTKSILLKHKPKEDNVRPMRTRSFEKSELSQGNQKVTEVPMLRNEGKVQKKKVDERAKSDADHELNKSNERKGQKKKVDEKSKSYRDRQLNKLNEGKGSKKRVDEKTKSNTDQELNKLNEGKGQKNKVDEKLKFDTDQDLSKPNSNVRRCTKRKSEVSEKDTKTSLIEKEINKKVEVTPEKDLKKKKDVFIEKELRKRPEVMIDKDFKVKPEVITEKDLKKKLDNDLKKTEPSVEKNLSKKQSLEKDLTDKIDDKVLRKRLLVNLEKDANIKTDVPLERRTKILPILDKELRKKPESNTNRDVKENAEISLEKETKNEVEINVDKEMKQKSEASTIKNTKTLHKIEKDKTESKKIVDKTIQTIRTRSEPLQNKKHTLDRNEGLETLEAVAKLDVLLEKKYRHDEKSDKKSESEAKMKKHKLTDNEVEIADSLAKLGITLNEKRIQNKNELEKSKSNVKLNEFADKKRFTRSELQNTESNTNSDAPSSKKHKLAVSEFEMLEISSKLDVSNNKKNVLESEDNKLNKSSGKKCEPINEIDKSEANKKSNVSSEKKTKLVNDEVQTSIKNLDTKLITMYVKKKLVKSDKTTEKKKMKNEILKEPKVIQRPTRKTKEAAAIYMEILGHKLINEDNIDDDNISIDSFPELPNVRKTEQRENELKAIAKSAKSKSDNNDKISLNQKGKKSNLQEPLELSNPKTDFAIEEDLKQKVLEKEKAVDNLDPLIVKVNKLETSILTKAEKKVIDKTKKSTFISPSEAEQSEIDIKKDSIQDLAKVLEINHPRNLDCSLDTKALSINVSSSESDESTTSKPNETKVRNQGRNRKFTKTVTPRLDYSFSDSDEEPLSKLTLSKSKQNNNKSECPHEKPILKRKPMLESDCKTEPAIKQLNEVSTNVFEKQKDRVPKKEQPTNYATKPKRECTKRPQNYLTVFSSSEEDERYFHGFMKTEYVKPNKSLKQNIKCHQPQSADLLSKDVDKRFGKGKVNMSKEQIEKWLKDSALAGNSLKKESFEEKNLSDSSLLLGIPSKIQSDLKVLDVNKLESEIPDKPNLKNTSNMTDASKRFLNLEAKHSQTSFCLVNKSVERKTIFRKERKVPTPNVSAFSPNNESSVYAFEADTEEAISTPFRRPSRRPSSTATSRSEDSSKHEESSRTSRFRLPSTVKQEPVRSGNKPEVSVMLSTDQSNSNASIAVQLDLESTEIFPETVATRSSDNREQLFYIPLQPGKQSSSQLIQGVAVKLGTKGASGQNQTVVMSAKLVTHSPIGAHQLTEKPATTSTSMYPPQISSAQKPKLSDNYPRAASKSARSFENTPENIEDFKYKVPSSPSASSSSSIKASKRQQIKTRIRSFEVLNPIVSTKFPTSTQNGAVLIEAPVFYPNEKEFQDPLEYIEKIRSQAETFGICRIVPPSNFKPDCKVSDDMRFTAYNQYVHKMLHRWGPNFKEFMAITKYLETQNIALTHPPWIGGIEIDLPRLYQIVQSLGGLKEVIEKKKWPKVSELMKIPKSAQDRVTKLDDIYCKYLLPYDTLSLDEREKLFDEVETEWAKHESRALLRAQQKINSRDASPNSELDSDDESNECIVKGRNMALNTFYRIARNTMSMWFKTMEPSAQEVEQEFWKHVNVRQNHICVHSGSIDSGGWGYGFAVSKNSPFARHAWNLKVLTNNSGSVLRSMGPVMGVTVPTLHVGMVFTGCCWYRDPHSLPWIEYLHTGGNKIWYGIPDSMSEPFHSTLIKLVPNYCRNKSLWLPSDTAMVPPSILVENGVSLSRTIQEPGHFMVVFPRVFTSSICTGYVVSESVYFAPSSWLFSAQKVFDKLQDSREPSMFSLERLLISVALDVRSNVDVLKQIVPCIEFLCEKETLAWSKLHKLGLTNKEKLPLPEAPLKKRKRLPNDSNDYECEICCKNLFISWVIESQEEIYCLEHAIEYVEKKKIEIQNCKLVYTYDSKELKSLIDKVQSTIELKLQKKVTGKST